MKKLLLSISALGCLTAMTLSASAQKRYVDDVFTAVVKTSNLEYDSNRSVNVLGVPPIITVKLRCDVYTPQGDTASKRPTIFIASTGSFLPTILNNQTTGSKDDSSIVELCTRFARKGYTVVALNYRQGWNPQTTIQEVATEQLLKATYRGIQDVRNCIRFMNDHAATYGVDTNMIIVGGQGTGGYIALALGTVDKRAEIEGNLKFLRGDASPMVNVDTLGDWNGLGGLALPGFPFYFNYGGEANLSAKAHMVFNYGGAMGDLAWLEANSLPVVSMHSVSDPFAPFGTGNVIVPTTGIVVIPNASGAGTVIPKANTLGVNAKINAAVFSDPYTAKAMQLSGNVKNLYPFFPPTPGDGAPWEWWDSASVASITSITVNGIPGIPANGHKADSLSRLTNRTMSAAKGRAYVDTVVSFIAPRIAAQFDLAVFTGVNETASMTNALTVYPNPAKTNVTVTLPVAISTITLVDITGKEVMTVQAAGNSCKLELNNVKPGMYFINATTVKGQSAVKRIVVE